MLDWSHRPAPNDHSTGFTLPVEPFLPEPGCEYFYHFQPSSNFLSPSRAAPEIRHLLQYSISADWALIGYMAQVSEAYFRIEATNVLNMRLLFWVDIILF